MVLTRMYQNGNFNNISQRITPLTTNSVQHTPQAGNVLMRIINTHYKLTIPYQFTKVNTSKLGYFATMKGIVDTGDCDVAIASTNLDANRLPQVHFNCPYGTSSPVSILIATLADPLLCHLSNTHFLNTGLLAFCLRSKQCYHFQARRHQQP